MSRHDYRYRNAHRGHTLRQFHDRIRALEQRAAREGLARAIANYKAVTTGGSRP